MEDLPYNGHHLAYSAEISKEMPTIGMILPSHLQLSTTSRLFKTSKLYKRALLQ